MKYYAVIDATDYISGFILVLYIHRISYRSAIDAEADVLLIGDKDFLESGLKNPINPVGKGKCL